MTTHYHESKIQIVPIYDFMRLQVVITNDHEKINKQCGLKYKSLYGHCLYGSMKIKGVDRVMITIVINPYGVDKVDAGLIAHECVHAKNMIFERAGVKNSHRNDEPEAYLMKWLVNTVTGYYDKIISNNTTL